MYVWLTDYQTDELLSVLRHLLKFPGNDQLHWLKGVIIQLEKNKIINRNFPKIVGIVGAKNSSIKYQELEDYMITSNNWIPVRIANKHCFNQREFAEYRSFCNQVIDLCDEIAIFNKDGKIGDQTKERILYAHATAKKINVCFPEYTMPDWFKELDQNVEI